LPYATGQRKTNGERSDAASKHVSGSDLLEPLMFVAHVYALQCSTNTQNIRSATYSWRYSTPCVRIAQNGKHNRSIHEHKHWAAAVYASRLVATKCLSSMSSHTQILMSLWSPRVAHCIWSTGQSVMHCLSPSAPAMTEEQHAQARTGEENEATNYTKLRLRRLGHVWKRFCLVYTAHALLVNVEGR
jgi:hypothetical protein